MATPAALAAAASFAAQLRALTQDATSVLGAIYGLAGNLGRYAAPSVLGAPDTEAAAIAAAGTARATIDATLAALTAAVAAYGDVPGAAQATLDALAAAMLAPADQLRAFAVLAAVPGADPVAVLCRRLAAVALSLAAAAYQPSSYDDAQSILGQVAATLEAVIAEAGDAGDDASFSALQSLETAVLADLTGRGASLAPLVAVTMPTNLPSLVVAQRLYADSTREDELVRRVDPIHPLFMPAHMLVLAS